MLVCLVCSCCSLVCDVGRLKFLSIVMAVSWLVVLVVFVFSMCVLLLVRYMLGMEVWLFLLILGSYCCVLVLKWKV